MWIFDIVEPIYLGLSQVSLKIIQRVALDWGWKWLAHHRRARHHAERVKSDLRAVAVRVGDEFGLKHAIVADRRNGISHRVLCVRYQQVILVITDSSPVTKRIGIFPWQEKVPACPH